MTDDLKSLYDEDGIVCDGVTPKQIAVVLMRLCPWLKEADFLLARTFGQLEVAASHAFSLITAGEEGETVDSDAMLKALGEFRQIRAQQNQVADRLGLSPRARAALGHQDEGEDEDVLL